MTDGYVWMWYTYNIQQAIVWFVYHWLAVLQVKGLESMYLDFV